MILDDRFWSKVNKDAPGGCWEWTAGNVAGYGLFWGRKPRGMARAHRLSWEAVNGPIPTGLDVCHHCDNPPRINPGHLFLGTRHDNMEDARIKGRLAGTNTPMRGATNGNAKLDEATVRRVRERYAERRSYAAVGAEFGISFATVAQIATRKTWRHVV